MLLVVVLSASATFAADSSDVVAIDDVDDEVIAADVADDVNSDPILKDESPVVTKDNFHDYFDDAGYLTFNADELVFEGDFSDLDVSAITIYGEKAVKFTGNGATFKNTQFMIMQNDVTIDGFNFITDDANEHTRLIHVIGTEDVISNILLSNNNITFVGPEDSEAYVIYAGVDEDMGSYGISGLQIINNNITYVGNSDGTEINNVIRVNGDTEEEEASDKILVQGNTFNVQIPSIKVNYGYYGEANPVSEAIVFYYCDDVKFIDNRIDIKYNNAIGSSDTIYVVSAYGDSIYGMASSHIVIDDNVIAGVGNSAIYGIKVSAETLEIINNTIDLSSDVYYVNGINVEGPSSYGVVANNTISLKATTDKYTSVYGVYAWQNMELISEIKYDNNIIDVEGYLACGMEINQPDPIISNNVINATGNFTYGIAASIRPASDEGIISNNEIVCLGNNVGIASGDAILKTASAGISTLGNAIISNNKINSTSVGIISVEQGTVSISENTINVIAKENKNNYAIDVEEVESLVISDNNVTFVGISDGYAISNAVQISDVDEGVLISGNAFDITIPSAAVGWQNIPAGSDTWIQSPISEGIVIDSSDDLKFINNNIKLKYGDVIGDYDTIYAVDIKNSANAVVDNNNLDVAGHTYMYGVIISGENLTVSNNNVTSSSDSYYANCIDVEGPATGVIKNNKFTAISPTLSYPVYGAMSNGDVSVNITDNEIFGDAYLVYGVQIGGKDVIVKDNNITAVGNHTIGIGTHTDNLKVIGNNIIADATNVGDQYIWETMGTDSAAIKTTNGIVKISDNTIQSTSVGIKVDGPSEVTISNSKIDVTVAGDVNNYAVYVDGADKFTMTGNNVTFVGATNGTTITNAIHVVDSTAEISGNNFVINVPAADVVYAADWSSTVISEGIVIDSCDNLKFENNNMDLTYGEVSGYYDTIYAIDIINSNNASIKENKIDANGNQYIYGLKITGNNFTIDSNNITAISNYYANGIDVEGPATGVISNNKILANAPGSVYPIYSGMNGLPVSVNITGNDLVGEGYYVVGVELGGQEAIVKDNNITIKGNHTIGIGSVVDNLTVDNNQITSEASNEGNVEIWDSMGTDTIGIKVVKGNATISNNNVQTTGDYAVDLGNANATVTDNYLAAKKGVGDSSVVNGDQTTISGGSPNLKTILAAVDLYTVYDSGDIYYVTALDENGDPIKNATLFLTVGGKVINETTDQDGIASFFVDEWDVGEYIVTVSYDGNETYGPKSITGFITIDQRESVIVAPKSVNVLLTAVKKGSYYTITLKDDRDNGLDGEKVAITFNGKTKTYTTDDFGVIKFKLSATKAGTQKLTVKFDSNSNYYDATLTATVKINKEVTKLTAKKKTFKAKKKTKKYTITLKDSKGKAINKVKVTIKVGKKTFKAKTNAKGKAIFKIKKLNKKGTYKAKVKFAGNALYKAVTKTVKIKVKK